MVTGIEHTAICAKDTKSLKDWYITMFDFKQAYDNQKGTYFLKAADGAMIEFITAEGEFEAAGEKAGGIRHLAFSVDNFEETAELLINNKVDIVSQPMVFPNGIKTFFFRDPEGNVLHLISRPEPL